MKNKKLIAVATAGLGSLLLIGSTGSAFAADATPAPSSSPTAHATPHPSASHTADPAKKAQHEANAAARKAANDTFKAAIAKAKGDLQAVLASNPTPEAKTAAKAACKAAVQSARAAHQAAMLAINPNWTPHTKGEHQSTSGTASN